MKRRCLPRFRRWPTRPGTSTWDVSVDSAVARGRASTPPASAGTRCAEGAAQGGLGLPSPPVRHALAPVPWLADRQVPPGLRAGPETPRPGQSRPPGSPVTARVHRRTGRHRGRPPWRRPGSHPPGPDPWPTRPTAPRANRADPPCRKIAATIPKQAPWAQAPQEQGQQGRTVARLRQGHLQVAARRWSAASAGSSATAQSPPGTTS